jgi:hypothetical protein
MKVANEKELKTYGLALDPRNPNRDISMSELLYIQNSVTDSAAESQAGGGDSEENMPITAEATLNRDQSAALAGRTTFRKFRVSARQNPTGPTSSVGNPQSS